MLMCVMSLLRCSGGYRGFSKGSKKLIASALLDLGLQGLGDFRKLGGAERV
jgi:hypothetical protein